MPQARSRWMQHRNATWGVVSEAIRGLSKEFRDHNSLNHKRDLLRILEYANQGILTDSNESYPRIQLECVKRGYPPDNPETPDVMNNSLILKLRQIVILWVRQRPIRDYAHVRWSRNDTQRESLCKGAEPSVVHNGLHPDQSRHPAKLRFLRKHKMKIPYAGSKLSTQDINFDMTDYVIHWTKAASFPILLATGLVDNGC